MSKRRRKRKDECRAPDGAIERKKFHELAPLRDGHSAGNRTSHPLAIVF